MVTTRCKMLVKTELKNLDIHYRHVELGFVETMNEIPAQQLVLLRKVLLKSGLSLLSDKHSELLTKTRNLIIEMVHYSDEFPKGDVLDYISEKLGFDCTYLSAIFSEVNGLTIQNFITENKIERLKELLIYDELSLIQIAHKLNYRNVAHLTAQLKFHTGLAPSFFKGLKLKRSFNIKEARVS
jgi:YesN/AraC family two-component response regulator